MFPRLLDKVGQSMLAILPGLTHYSVFRSPLFATVTLNFLDQK